MEELSGGRHFRQIIFSRFIKFVTSLLKNRRALVRSLCKKSFADVRSVTGRNMRCIEDETGITMRQGKMRPSDISSWRMYTPSDVDQWRLPLLTSLLELRDNRWEVNFDDESEKLIPDEVQTLINGVSIRH